MKRSLAVTSKIYMTCSPKLLMSEPWQQLLASLGRALVAPPESVRSPSHCWGKQEGGGRGRGRGRGGGGEGEGRGGEGRRGRGGGGEGRGGRGRRGGGEQRDYSYSWTTTLN